MEIRNNYYTARELASQWNVTVRMIANYCSNGEIPGAEKMGSMWLIPKDAIKPVDKRYKSTCSQGAR